MSAGARLGLLLGVALLAAGALAWWRWGDAVFLASLGAMIC